MFRFAQHDRMQASKLQRFLGHCRLGEGGKFFPCDRAKAHTIARAQEHRRILCWIKKFQRRTSNQIPAPGRSQRINSRLRATDPDHTGRNFLAGVGAARRGYFLWQPCHKGKSGNEPDAGHSIISRTVEIDHFLCRDLRMSRDFIEIGRELWIVADWNFNSSRRGTAAPSALENCSSANSRRQPIEYVACCSACFGDVDRIEKNGDARVSRRKFDDARNGSASQLLKRLEDLVQRFLGRILKLLAYAHDECRISQGNNFHWRSDLVQTKRLIFAAPSFKMMHLLPPNFELKQLQQRFPHAL